MTAFLGIPRGGPSAAASQISHTRSLTVAPPVLEFAGAPRHRRGRASVPRVHRGAGIRIDPPTPGGSRSESGRDSCSDLCDFERTTETENEPLDRTDAALQAIVGPAPF